MGIRTSVCTLLVSLLLASVLQAQTAKPGNAAAPAPPKPAQAKPQPPAKPAARPTAAPKAYVAINGGYQPTSNNFSNAWTFDYHADTASATAQYAVDSSFLFDAGAGVRAWHDLMVGAAISRFSRSGDVSLTASAPHPFSYTFRDAQGSDTGIAHGETAVHLQAMWMLRPNGRVQVGLFGGPSIFSVQQAIVTRPTFVEVYPYDTVTVSGATTTEQSVTTIGFNVGTDFAYTLSRTIAFGVLLRFAHATASFEGPNKNAVDVRVGGVQVAGGIRLRFWGGKKAPGVKKPTTTPDTKGKPKEPNTKVKK